MSTKEITESEARETLTLFENDFSKYNFVATDSLIIEQARNLTSQYSDNRQNVTQVYPKLIVVVDRLVHLTSLYLSIKLYLSESRLIQIHYFLILEIVLLSFDLNTKFT